MDEGGADFYKLLGIGAKATEKEIKSAYRKALQENNFNEGRANMTPKERSDADEKARRIIEKTSQAKDVLLDPTKRAAYDAELEKRQNEERQWIEEERKRREKEAELKKQQEEKKKRDDLVEMGRQLQLQKEREMAEYKRQQRIRKEETVKQEWFHIGEDFASVLYTPKGRKKVGKYLDWMVEGNRQGLAGMTVSLDAARQRVLDQVNTYSFHYGVENTVGGAYMIKKWEKEKEKELKEMHTYSSLKMNIERDKFILDTNHLFWKFSVARRYATDANPIHIPVGQLGRIINDDVDPQVFREGFKKGWLDVLRKPLAQAQVAGEDLWFVPGIK